MDANELIELLSQGGHECSVFLGGHFEYAKPVTEALLELGFSHGCSDYSRKVCELYDESDYGDGKSFKWHYAHIFNGGIEYNNYNNAKIIDLTLEDLLNAKPMPEPTQEEIEALYLEVIGVVGEGA